MKRIFLNLLVVTPLICGVAVVDSSPSTTATPQRSSGQSTTRQRARPAAKRTPSKQLKPTVIAKPVFKIQSVDTAQVVALVKPRAEQPRPLLINLWATWCMPCREEFPDLVRIDDKYRPRGLQFYTVSVDEPSLIDTDVPDFLREMNAVRIPAYLLNIPEPATIIDVLDPKWKGALALPVTLLYDGRGKLVFKHSGRIKPDKLEEAIEKVIRAG